MNLPIFLGPQPHPGVVSSPHQMYGNGSNSFGVKPCRKRTPRRHVDDEDLLTDDEDEEELLGKKISPCRLGVDL